MTSCCTDEMCENHHYVAMKAGIFEVCHKHKFTIRNRHNRKLLITSEELTIMADKITAKNGRAFPDKSLQMIKDAGIMMIDKSGVKMPIVDWLKTKCSSVHDTEDNLRKV